MTGVAHLIVISITEASLRAAFSSALEMTTGAVSPPEGVQS